MFSTNTVERTQRMIEGKKWLSSFQQVLRASKNLLSVLERAHLLTEAAPEQGLEPWTLRIKVWAIQAGDCGGKTSTSINVFMQKVAEWPLC